MKKYFDLIFRCILIFVVLYFLSVPFIPNLLIRIISVLLLTLLLYKSISLHNASKGISDAREQLKNLLECLCTKVSSGNTIEASFITSSAEMKNIYGEKSQIYLALKSVEEKWNIGVPFDVAISELSHMILCPESIPLFDTISKMRHLGNKNLYILRQSLNMVSELLLVTKDISSDVSQKRLESTIMSAMPFCVLWSLELGAGSYMEAAFSSAFGTALILFAFVLSVSSYALSIAIVSYSVYSPVKKSKIQNLRDSSASIGTTFEGLSFSNFFEKAFVVLSKKLPATITLMKHLLIILPENYSLRIKRTLIYLYPVKILLLEEYIFIKICMSLFTILIFLVIGMFIPIPAFLYIAVVFLVLFLHDKDTEGKISKNKDRMMIDFPSFIGLLSTLLSNGIVLQKSLIMCIDTFYNSSAEFRYELNILKGDLGAGAPCSEALEKFADRCQIPEITSALILAAQYGRSGNRENLNLLKIQTSSCWIQAKISSRRRLEESSVKLLIPMILELVCVMIITITPSLMSLQLL